MGLFSGLRARRAAQRAKEAFARQGYTAAAGGLDGAGGHAWAQFALALYNDGHPTEAERAIRRALEVEPGRGDALIFLAELLAESDRGDEAIETYRRLLARFPHAGEQALALAALLRDREDFAGVRDVLAPLRPTSPAGMMMLAQAHYELDEHAAVVALLGPAVQRLKLELRQGMFGAAAHRELYAELLELDHLHGDSYAALHGREKVIESAAARGDLDASAGVNYRLLGESRMAKPPLWVPDTRLRSVDETLAFGQSLIAGGERSRGLCHVATAKLRQGRLDEARKRFDEARDEDDDNFAAYLGLGAAMDLAAGRAFERLKELDTPRDPPQVEQVVPEWPVLTPPERKVVALVLGPLARALPRLVEAGAVARILPIDARLTDLPEMARSMEAGERLDDHRCLEAVNGAAISELCASKIEELVGLTGQHDSTFAHEFAHLVHFHLSEPMQERIAALYDRALEHEHVATIYQTTNDAEFLAVAYTDYLAHRYQLTTLREPDDAGIIDDVFALFDELGG